jgi:hypothetical protein
MGFSYRSDLGNWVIKMENFIKSYFFICDFIKFSLLKCTYALSKKHDLV